MEVKDGIIYFKNSTAFEDAMNYFHNIGIEETHKMIGQLPNFKGLIEIKPTDIEDINRLNKALWKEDQQIISTSQTNSTSEEDDVLLPGETIYYDDFLVHDPFYEAVLNNYREVMIADLVIRNTEFGVFAYELPNKQNFENVYETSPFDNALQNNYTSYETIDEIELQVLLPDIYLLNRDIELFKNPPTYNVKPSCNKGTLARNGFGQLQDCDIIQMDKRNRIIATVYAQNLGVYSSVGMTSRRQRKFLGIWWNTTAERLSVEGEGYYSTKYPSGLIYTNYPYNRIQTRKDQLSTKKVESLWPANSWHTGQIGCKFPIPSFDKCKLGFKPAKDYEFKKHESDHDGWHNGRKYTSKIKHN
ncbi:MAG: hypothetical protein ACOYLT_10680 [Flavobacterium sp.]|uniref:hypothetical protein n=1 Tax=Flavobacterium sp. TaxID=239 RepID=UPI003BDECD13